MSAEKFKELVLTICIIAPFILLFGTPHIDHISVQGALLVDIIAYVGGRFSYKINYGTWKW